MKSFADSANILQHESSNADFRTFWCNNFGFFEIYVRTARTRGRRLSQCGYFANKGEREFFTCGRPHFLVQHIGLFEIYGVSTRGRGLSQRGQFADKDVNFVYYGRCLL